MDTKKFPLVSIDSHENYFDFRNIFKINIMLPIVIAGPCSVEDFEMFEKTAMFLSNIGIKFLRAGLYKPRSSPYCFQGLRDSGLKTIKEISKKYNLITVSEITDIRDIEKVSKYIDIFQIGSRNMQNFDLLRELGKSKKPVLLKRGMCANLEEFILASEYLALEGNRNILMCERGIKTFETSVRNMLDISSIALIKKYTKLPIIVDLSHSLGRKDIIKEIAKSVLALGADGIMVETHPNPQKALSDPKQQLDFEETKLLLKYINIH